ncbi:MAG: hypothetical protein GX951_01360 [Mollicutes bacterium]|nr:hypothetical protein [Mollicutes bacterium]
MKRTLVNLEDDIADRIKIYQRNNNFSSVSKTINHLVNIALEKEDVSKDLKKIIDNGNLQISKTSYIINLLEQMYSDFNLDELTDPKKSVALRKFKNQLYRSFDD